MGDLLSVIIPTLDEGTTICRALLSVAYAAPEAELVVADGGSVDDTASIAAGFPGTRVLHLRNATRAALCNAGARVARGNLLLFLHADTTVTAAGIAEMRAALQRPRVIGGSFRFALADAVGRYRFTEWAANVRSRFLRLPFGDQGIFCRRDVFERCGGFPDLPLMDDVAFVRALRREGDYVLLHAAAHTSARRIVRHGVVKSGLRNWSLLLAYQLGIAPERLVRWYQ